MIKLKRQALRAKKYAGDLNKSLREESASQNNPSQRLTWQDGEVEHHSTYTFHATEK